MLSIITKFFNFLLSYFLNIKKFIMTMHIPVMDIQITIATQTIKAKGRIYGEEYPSWS